MLVKQEIGGQGGNYLQLTDMTLLVCSSKKSMPLENFDIALARTHDLEAEHQLSTSDYNHADVAPDLPKMSTVKVGAVTYIFGYAVKMATAKQKCYDCLEALLSKKDEPHLKCQALVNVMVSW